MTLPSLISAVDGTWPAARFIDDGAWILREGQGGGQRVSSATAKGPVTTRDIAHAETAMTGLGQEPLFMLRPGEDALDELLDARGYVVHDPVNIYICAPSLLTDKPIPRVTVFSIWEPLWIMRDIWAAGGIGPDRIAVMERAQGQKTGFLARWNEKPAGAAFAAIHDGIAMVHAVEILPHQRRQGVAQWMMRAAAFWAQQHGAETLAVLCTRANTGANALYTSLAMEHAGGYHYRRKPQKG